MESELWEKKEYLNPQRYITGKITEYDIKAANINILLKLGYLDDNTYRFLNILPKKDREVYIGKLHLKLKQEQGIELAKIIENEIKEYRHQFFIKNQITSLEVVRIANDAIYINRTLDCAYLDYGGVVFRPKMVATQMLNLFKILIFVWNGPNNQMEIDVKGLGPNYQIHHEFLSIICNTMYMMSSVSVLDALGLVQSFYKDYVNLNLPLPYYREFNSKGLYSLKNSNIQVSVLNEEDKGSLNISYNLRFIRELYSIVLEQYQMTKM